MYFNTCTNLNELKAAYKKLALKHHPDMGGDVRTMQQINAEYDKVFEILKRAQNAEAGKPDSKTRATSETPDKFKNIVDALIHIQGINIELCGSWLWIDGKTFENRAALKACGCMYSRTKKKWYWHHAEDGHKWSDGSASMASIRKRYGSVILTADEKDSRAALCAAR